MSRRVAVTGLGIVCPIGNSTEDVMNSVRNGRCGIAPITRYDTSYQKVKLAGEVKDLKIDAYIDPSEARKMGLYTQYALCAAIQAVRDSGLSFEEEDRQRCGVILGTGIGGIETIEQQQVRGEKHGFDRVNPFFIPRAISNMSAGHVALRFGLRGICETTVSACASSANAIGEAYLKVKEGRAEICLTGGSEAAVTPLSIGGFTSLQALSLSQDPARASIPFDKERNGFVMGEGGAVLVLEEYEHARRRGAHIYGEITGYGATCDAYHITSPDPDAKEAAACIRLAMEEAGLSPEDVDYINAHGTSTHLNDSCETKAIRAVFGDAADHLKVSSTKSMTGHMLGAAAAVEAVITLLAMEEGFVPPTIGLRVPDPECDLDYVPETGYSCPIRNALSESFGFGGHNVCLAFRREDKA